MILRHADVQFSPSLTVSHIAIFIVSWIHSTDLYSCSQIHAHHNSQVFPSSSYV